ncbi:NAD-dependent epimerase/dehydratase family protein [Candidatus Bipolaricaulota bacterium]
MKVQVTGANGFIGRHLIHGLLGAGHEVRAIVRSESAATYIPDGARSHVISDPQRSECWSEALADCDTVIHLIGLAHAAARDKTGLMERFRETNVELTGRVVDACIHNGVRRLIYLSSVKAVGEGSSDPYTEASECLPENPYGISKREAEMLILERTQNAPIEASIVRPPFVYGPGVKGNIARMLKLVHSGLPLPIRCLKARQSMVYVGNLVDALCCMAKSRQPVEGIYHTSDAEPPITTREMLIELGTLMEKRVIEVPVPAPVLRVIGRLVGMGDEASRLTRTLMTQGARLTAELGWTPPYSMEEGMIATVQWFVDQKKGGEC